MNTLPHPYLRLWARFAVGLLPVLVYLTWFCWQHRYVAEPNWPEFVLGGAHERPLVVLKDVAGVSRAGQGGAQSLCLRAGPETGKPSLELPLIPWPEGGFAHVKARVRSEKLIPGELDWQIGRILITWIGKDGKTSEDFQLILGISYNRTEDIEMMVPMDSPGEPRLSLQNLGASGQLVIERLELRCTRHAAWFLPARVLCILVWLSVMLGIIHGWLAPHASILRGLLVSLVFLYACARLVLPGPWEPYRPIVKPFAVSGAIPSTEYRPLAGPNAMGAPMPEPISLRLTVPDTSRDSARVPGKLESGPLKKTFMLVKQNARALLHVAAFWLLSGFFVFVLRSRAAALLAVVIAFGSELMQWLYGFGFDWADIGDLAVNGIGIVGGLWLALILCRRRQET